MVLSTSTASWQARSASMESPGPPREFKIGIRSKRASVYTSSRFASRMQLNAIICTWIWRSRRCSTWPSSLSSNVWRRSMHWHWVSHVWKLNLITHQRLNIWMYLRCQSTCTRGWVQLHAWFDANRLKETCWATFENWDRTKISHQRNETREPPKWQESTQNL